MNKYRSKVSPITIGVNLALYLLLILLAIFKSKDNLIFMLGLIVIVILLSLRKFLSYKYYLNDIGLVIIDKSKEILILYKDIKYIEEDTKESGLLHGYGLKKILVSKGKGVSSSYLITVSFI